MTRPSKRSIGIAVGIAALATAGIVTDIAVQPQATEVCVTVYEDAGQSGDHRAFCALPATAVHIPDLTVYTTPLVNGCNRGINQSSSYNDCISSATVGLLPASTKLIFYRNANYGSDQTCYDVDGTHAINLTGTNDTISSFKIIGGNC